MHNLCLERRIHHRHETEQLHKHLIHIISVRRTEEMNPDVMTSRMPQTVYWIPFPAFDCCVRYDLKSVLTLQVSTIIVTTRFELKLYATRFMYDYSFNLSCSLSSEGLVSLLQAASGPNSNAPTPVGLYPRWACWTNVSMEE